MPAFPLPYRILSPQLGCEIDFDLQRRPTSAELDAMQALYDRHHLVLFRNQRLSMEQQAEVAGYFGPVLHTKDGLAYISNVRKDGVLGDKDLGFHSDLSFAEYPYSSLSLHAIDVVNDVTSTRFVSSIAAYRRLPENMRQRIAGLRVMHVSAGNRMSGRPEKKEYPDFYPQWIRSLVIRHPKTGVPILYAMENQTVRILDMSEDDSEALLQDLFKILYAPDMIFEHRWRLGDILIWDNLALQHARSSIAGRGNRTLQRTAAGEKGLFVQYPRLDGLYTNK